MPVRRIGRTVTYDGKFLFDILCNLKNFGTGRIVVRKSFLERYPEPSYYVVKKSMPDMTHAEIRRGHIIADRVFRGKEFGEVKITSVYKPDWALVPKNEEEKLLNNKLAYAPREAPLSVDMPPLLAKLYIEKLRKQGHEPKPEDTKLFLRINRGENNRAIQTPVLKVEEQLPPEERKIPPTWQERVEYRKKLRRGIRV